MTFNYLGVAVTSNSNIIEKSSKTRKMGRNMEKQKHYHAEQVEDIQNSCETNNKTKRLMKEYAKK